MRSEADEGFDQADGGVVVQVRTPPLKTRILRRSDDKLQCN